MKLGEALSLRALQAQQLNDLRGRINANSFAQEGQETQENAQELLQEYERLSGEHEALVLRIARTNVISTLDHEIQHRENLRRLRNTLETAARTVSASQTGGRYMRSELRMVAHLDTAALYRRMEELTEQIRRIDARIQQRNWETDLYEE